MFPDFVRVGLLLLGAALVLGGVAGLALHVPTVAPLVGGVIVIFGALFERWRYKPLQAGAGPGFEPTGERFLDPGSDTPVRVYANPTTGERRYVKDTGRPDAGP